MFGEFSGSELLLAALATLVALFCTFACPNMCESLFFGAVSIAAFIFKVVVFVPGEPVAVGNVFAWGMRDVFFVRLVAHGV